MFKKINDILPGKKYTLHEKITIFWQKELIYRKVGRPEIFCNVLLVDILVLPPSCQFYCVYEKSCILMHVNK